MMTFFHDLRYAFRSLRRRPGFTAVAITTLTLGIGGSAAVFSIADEVFWRPLPLRRPDRLVRIRDTNRAEDGNRSVFNVSGQHVLEMRQNSTIFSGVAAFEWGSAALIGGDGPERVSVVHSSARWWNVLGIKPRLGRTPSASEDGRAPESGVALVSSGLWNRRFGGNFRLLGQTLHLDTGPVTVVGIMPRGFAFPYDADLWVPDRIRPGTSGDYAVFARLAPGIDPDKAQSAMNVLADRIRSTSPETSPGYGIEITPIRESLMEGHGRITRALGLLVILLLGIASVNTGTLVISRNVGRARELEVRRALGASPARLVRQLAAEGLVLSVVSAALGFASTPLLLRLLQGIVPSNLSAQLGMAETRIDARMLAAAAGTILITEIFVGVLPAFHRSRGDFVSALQSAEPAGPARNRVSRTFASAQIGLALILLSGAMLVGANLRRLLARSLGFDPENLLAVQIDLPLSSYGTPGARDRLVERLLEDVRGLPGAKSAGITTTNPLWGGTWNSFAVSDRADTGPDALGLNVNHRLVTPGLFATLGIPLRRGRLFSRADRSGSDEVVIVSAHMAHRLWPGEDPIGRRVRVGPARRPSFWKRVVGVVGDIRDAGDDVDTWYLPYAQQAGTEAAARIHVIVRTAGSPENLARPVGDLLHHISPTLVVTRAAPMTDLYSETFGPERDGTVVVTLFATIGLILASIGTLGVISMSAARQAREIGIRIALGARPRDIFARLEKEAAILAVLGVGAGAAGSVAVNLLLAGLLAEEPTQAPAILVSAAILTLCALAAAALPALRMARTAPADSLRNV